MMLQLPTHQPAHDRRTTPRSGHAPGMLPADGSRVLLAMGASGVLLNPDIHLVTEEKKRGCVCVLPLQTLALALHLAREAGEIDAGELARSLGQQAHTEAASAYRRVAMDVLQRLTAMGLLRCHGTYWTPTTTEAP